MLPLMMWTVLLSLLDAESKWSVKEMSRYDMRREEEQLQQHSLDVCA
jgi:hypothetical protein